MNPTRTLTILFSDIVGSTELLSGLGTRAADQLLEVHLGMLGEQVRRFSGQKVKTLGDGIMATFESGQDGIDCAVAMQQACSRPGSGRGRPLHIRIGLSSGDVRSVDGDCFGVSVVEASRLCAIADGGQILLGDTTRLLARGHRALRVVGPIELRGLSEPVSAWEARWSAEAPMQVRAILADDAALVREGVARVLEEAGIEVVGQAGDGTELLEKVAALRPHVAIVDMRMPPTYTTEGLDVARRLRAEHPGIGVLVLSQDLQEHYAGRLLAESPTHVGYLLKERVVNLSAFADAVRRVASGGTAFEASLVMPILDGQRDPGVIVEVSPEQAKLLGERATGAG